MLWKSLVPSVEINIELGFLDSQLWKTLNLGQYIKSCIQSFNLLIFYEFIIKYYLSFERNENFVLNIHEHVQGICHPYIVCCLMYFGYFGKTKYFEKKPNLGIKNLSCFIIWKRNGSRHETISSWLDYQFLKTLEVELPIIISSRCWLI